METQVTMADIEQQFGRMVIQLLQAGKLIEQSAAKIAELEQAAKPAVPPADAQ